MPITIPVQPLLSMTAVQTFAVPAAVSDQAVTTLDSFALMRRDIREAEESCNAPLYSAAALLALPFLWAGLRWLGVGQKSLEKKYETIVGLLITGREMYGRDISRECEGRINPGGIYVLLDRLKERGIIESREVQEVQDGKRYPRLLFRLAIPPKYLPAYLIEDEIVLQGVQTSQKFFPLEIEVSHGGIRLHNQSPQDDPVLYSVKFSHRHEVGLSRGSYSVILGPRAMIYSSDGSAYWLCVEKDLCRLVKIKMTA